MKKFLYLTIFSAFSISILAQNVTFSFANAMNTSNGGTDYYEIDVMISSTAPFKLGSGQLYFNYNISAFGPDVHENNKVEITHPTNYVLGQKDNWLNILNVYGDFFENDNSDARFSYAWQQSKEGDCINQNVGVTPALLFHIKLEYINISQPPNFCFESGPLFTDQTYTHCGPNDGVCSLADENCITEQGIQITDDFFDCAGAPLPVELTQFAARPLNETDALLNWQTASEANTSHFEILRSTDGINWHFIGETEAAGESQAIQNYSFVDEQVHRVGSPDAAFYYRLKIVDKDGSFEFSQVRQVGFDGNNSIGIFPNPTAWGVNILASNEHRDDLLTVEVFSPDGRLAMKEVLKSEDGTLHFPASMQSGIYNLVIRTEDGVASNHRVILQR
ncbi:MAG: T9SS type A sorting domain-containing protein [Saprospiraceae bacterium]|nr:T9SS type A sorting domain-containing protein [Saprospiraceae bacterium]MCF8251645.1 T9SS type A sorting domain-containing protein [Saprospiraceae bacterium]MCF8281055.1 T9SS type A sorting domain-containing protein [Bacteroidales bacterium]MCF8313264.1 T9SS type A sorting domain-containing protein [Saprospiraceae bacterium]MCF8442008.1 T9SS type A sorting domain-containing protein [Saprospiraceae bacterium]